MEREISQNQDTDTPTNASPWPVMILAHNEEKRIRQCIDSLFDGELGHPLEVFVMANGCTDATETIVLEYAKQRPSVHLISIELGDKCNAWNVFIHQTVPARCPERPEYFFMDGDARIVPGSLSVMAEALRRNPDAHAASAPPASGRSMSRDRNDLLEQRALVANLYSLRGSFVKKLQRLSVRLPLKLEGDDGLLGALIKWDLDPKRDWDHRRIVPCAAAGFVFDSVALSDPSEWRSYWRRAVRYGRRHYEFQLLGPRLKREGLEGLPSDITKMYSEADSLKLRVSGIYTLTNWIALQQMRAIGDKVSGQ